VKKKSRVIADAEAAEVHVVDEGFLAAVAKGGAALLITQHSIAPWGADVSARIAMPPPLTVSCSNSIM
jgi:hypothetical protein